VLVWSACYGILDEGAPLERAWSALHQISRRPYVHAVLGRWNANFGHGPLGLLIERLAVGTPIGRALAEYNQTPGVWESGCQFILMGDPLLTAPASANYEYVLPPPASSHPTEVRSDDLRQLSVHEGTPAAGPSGRASPCDDRLRNELEFLERCLTHPPPDGHSPALAQFQKARGQLLGGLVHADTLHDTQKAALEVLSQRTAPYVSWIPLASTHKFVREGTCGHCGQSLIRTIYEIPVVRSQRQLAACVRCHIVADAPSEWDIDFKVEPDGRLALLGTPPAADFLGTGKAWSFGIKNSMEFVWPRDSARRPMRSYHSPTGWPPAVTRISLWFMFGAQYTMLSHLVPGQDPAVQPTPPG
jgi:hypothetical protein